MQCSTMWLRLLEVRLIVSASLFPVYLPFLVLNNTLDVFFILKTTAIWVKKKKKENRIGW